MEANEITNLNVDVAVEAMTEGTTLELFENNPRADPSGSMS